VSAKTLMGILTFSLCVKTTIVTNKAKSATITAGISNKIASLNVLGAVRLNRPAISPTLDVTSEMPCKGRGVGGLSLYAESLVFWIQPAQNQRDRNGKRANDP